MGEPVATCTDMHYDARKCYCRGIDSESDGFGVGIVSFGTNVIANVVSSHFRGKVALDEIGVPWVEDENADQERC